MGFEDTVGTAILELASSDLGLTRVSPGRN